MSKTLLVKPILKALLIIYACLCSFLLHACVCNTIVAIEHQETHPLETFEFDACDMHAHEEDMLSPGKLIPSVLAFSANRVGRFFLSAPSCTPNPFIPPPKI